MPCGQNPEQSNRDHSEDDIRGGKKVERRRRKRRRNGYKRESGKGTRGGEKKQWKMRKNIRKKG